MTFKKIKLQLFSGPLRIYCADSNMEVALSLRHSHCGDVGPTGSSSQHTIWHQGAKESETINEPGITQLSAWILCSCSFPMDMSSKYYNNQLWPNQHVMPGATMTQDWKAAAKLEPGTEKAMFNRVWAGLGLAGLAYVFVLYLFCVFVLCIWSTITEFTLSHRYISTASKRNIMKMYACRNYDNVTTKWVNTKP